MNTWKVSGCCGRLPVARNPGACAIRKRAASRERRSSKGRSGPAQQAEAREVACVCEAERQLAEAGAGIAELSSRNVCRACTECRAFRIRGFGRQTACSA